MKNLRCWTALTVTALLGSWVVPVGAGATEAEDAADMVKCKSACDVYHAAAVKGTSTGDITRYEKLSYKYVKDECGAIPTSGKSLTTGSEAGRVSAESQGIDPNLQTGNKEWDDCYAALQTRWGILGQHCAAMAISETGKTQELVTAIAYTVAASACGIACAAEKTGVGGATKAICIGTGTTANLVDIAATITVIAIGKNERGLESTVMDMGSMLGGVGGAALSVAGESCWAGLSLGAAAGLKYANFGIMAGNTIEHCRNVNVHESKGPDLYPDTPDKPKVGVLRQEVASSTSTRNGTAGSTGGAPVSDYSASLPEHIEDFPKGQFAMALAGPFGTLFGAIDNKDKMPAFLEKATGLTVKDIGKRLESGQSPGQIISGISGLGDVGTQIAKIDQDIKDGKIRLKGMEAIATSSGGGGKGATKPAAAANPFGMFGMKSPSMGGGTGGEQTFEKTKKEIAPSPEGDIWHEGYAGTIFQIVSGKLVKERERVDQVEWDTPLNRALAGLPSKKKK